MSSVRDKKPGFDSEFTGTILKIKLRGEIDHHSAVAVRSAMDDMIKAKHPQKLIIDMSAVDFMDSSGLGLIMGRYALMKEQGGETFVSDPCPGTEKIMRLAGMERIVKIIRSSGAVPQADTGERPAQAVSMATQSAATGQPHRTSPHRKAPSKRKTTGGENR